jgi:hypothetical protein
VLGPMQTKKNKQNKIKKVKREKKVLCRPLDGVRSFFLKKSVYGQCKPKDEIRKKKKNVYNEHHIICFDVKCIFLEVVSLFFCV